MRYAINLPAFGEFADIRTLATLAHEAEEAGWDGFFLWDHIQAEPGLPVADPWIALTAMALQTEQLLLGPMVTPLPRRHPWKLAREAASLDQLCGGRLILGVGIGGDNWFHEYSTFGESTDNKLHAAMLDEGLAVLTGLWSGQPFSYQGQHYTVQDTQFLPTPQQKPRIPIWVAGVWPNKAPMRRAARWDGVFPVADGRTLQPAEIQEMLSYIQQYRTSDEPFDVVMAGSTANLSPKDADNLLRSYADAGVRWWQEGFMWNDSIADVRKLIQQGPPRI